MATSPNKGHFANVDTLVRNVLTVWERVTKQDLADGINWYVEAKEIVNALAAATDYRPEQIAGVMSAMSPRMPWGRNKTVTREIVERHSIGNYDVTGIGLHSNVRLSFGILDGDAPEATLKNKRLAFYQNILGDLNRATVDSWMVKAIFGPDTDFQTPGSWYHLAEKVIILASEQAGLNPRDFQAAVWVRLRKDVLTDTQHAAAERE